MFVNKFNLVFFSEFKKYCYCLYFVYRLFFSFFGKAIFFPSKHCLAPIYIAIPFLVSLPILNIFLHHSLYAHFLEVLLNLSLAKQGKENFGDSGKGNKSCFIVVSIKFQNSYIKLTLFCFIVDPGK